MSDESWLDIEESTDWLGVESKKNPLIEALYDDVTPRTQYPVLPQGIDPKYIEAVKAARAIRPNQRVFIRLLVKHGGNYAAAIREYNTILPRVSAQTPYRWIHNENFKTALAAAKESFLAMSGTDTVSVLVKSQNLIEEAMTPRRVWHKGKRTREKKIELGIAARMVEFQGKAAGIGDEDKRARITIQVIDMSGEPEKVVSVVGD